MSTYEIGYIIGPCINAAGRLDTAELSFNLFNENDPMKLAKIVGEMLDTNRVRQDLTARAYENAVYEVELRGSPVDRMIVLYMPGTHESICGIVAGKIKDKYSRPVIILTDAASKRLKGSGRSVEGFDLLNCVKRADKFLLKYGGHKMAVGVMLEKDNFELFRCEIIERCGIGDETITPKERIDVCLTPEDVTMDLAKELTRLEPFGRGNEKPVFALKGLLIEYASLIGAKRNVVKMKLRPVTGDAQTIDAILFGDSGLFMQKLDIVDDGSGQLICRSSPRVCVDVTFHTEINDYNGFRKVQLIIRSIRKAA